METFRRYIPKSEVEALKADLAERTLKQVEAQGNGEVTGQPDQANPSACKQPQGTEISGGETP